MYAFLLRPFNGRIKLLVHMTQAGSNKHNAFITQINNGMKIYRDSCGDNNTAWSPFRRNRQDVDFPVFTPVIVLLLQRCNRITCDHGQGNVAMVRKVLRNSNASSGPVFPCAAGRIHRR
jgi:hypothetical protein